MNTGGGQEAYAVGALVSLGMGGQQWAWVVPSVPSFLQF